MAKNIPAQADINSNIETLSKQSRSFAIPILNLDLHLLTPIMVEYNLNKTIDTIEDSTTLNSETKENYILQFCAALKQGKVSTVVQKHMMALTPHQESYVFKNYNSTIALYNSLPNPVKNIIYTRTLEMAKGMIKFLNNKISTLSELNEYCYFVAGSVGVYLTEVFNHFYPLSPRKYKTAKSNSIGFGLFLQKLNIIRDYTEDCQKNAGSYWPKELFKKLKRPINVLNHLCLDTLTKDIPQAINYYKDIHEENTSFDNFLKFLLSSGLEYIKILKNNKNIFTKNKVKLPKTLISQLYKSVAKQDKQQFIDYCEKTLQNEILSYKALI